MGEEKRSVFLNNPPCISTSRWLLASQWSQQPGGRLSWPLRPNTIDLFLAWAKMMISILAVETSVICIPCPVMTDSCDICNHCTQLAVTFSSCCRTVRRFVVSVTWLTWLANAFWHLVEHKASANSSPCHSILSHLLYCTLCCTSSCFYFFQDQKSPRFLW